MEPVQSTTVDAKFHVADRFDDLLSRGESGTRVRRQFKHSESPMAFERSFLTSETYDLRVDQLIKSWQSDLRMSGPRKKASIILCGRSAPRNANSIFHQGVPILTPTTQGEWGVTQHVIGLLGRHDDVALAAAMWDEARESMLVRLPGHETAHGPFLPFEPTLVPTWTHDDAALFLILARISHPELRRKTAALSAAAWLTQREPAKCVIAFREILKASLCFTHQLWLLHILGQFEPAPFVITQALGAELNAFVASGRCGTEQLALMLLNRAKVPVSGQLMRTKPIVSVTLPTNKMQAIMSLDVHGVAQQVAKLWPEFPEIVAGRFESIMRSDESHEEKARARWEARRSISRKSHPLASLHGWDSELFADSLNEVLTGLEEYLWSKGEWNDHIWREVLSLLLPNAEIPVRHYWTRWRRHRGLFLRHCLTACNRFNLFRTANWPAGSGLHISRRLSRRNPASTRSS